jgi:hypothetical protein
MSERSERINVSAPKAPWCTVTPNFGRLARERVVHQ